MTTGFNQIRDRWFWMYILWYQWIRTMYCQDLHNVFVQHQLWSEFETLFCMWHCSSTTRPPWHLSPISQDKHFVTKDVLESLKPAKQIHSTREIESVVYVNSFSGQCTTLGSCIVYAEGQKWSRGHGLQRSVVAVRNMPVEQTVSKIEAAPAPRYVLEVKKIFWLSFKWEMVIRFESYVLDGYFCSFVQK